MDALTISLTPEQVEATIHWAACDRAYAFHHNEDPSPAVQQLAGQVEAAICQLVAPADRQTRLVNECLTLGCRKRRETRGLCRECYNHAAIEVKAGRTTWAAEIARGAALESLRPAK